MSLHLGSFWVQCSSLQALGDALRAELGEESQSGMDGADDGPGDSFASDGDRLWDSAGRCVKAGAESGQWAPSDDSIPAAQPSPPSPGCESVASDDIVVTSRCRSLR